jgi:hypothetical protein
LLAFRILLRFIKIGGAEGGRTPDLMTASHALSQLSYSPTVLKIIQLMVSEVKIKSAMRIANILGIDEL